MVDCPVWDYDNDCQVEETFPMMMIHERLQEKLAKKTTIFKGHDYDESKDLPIFSGHEVATQNMNHHHPLN